MLWTDEASSIHSSRKRKLPERPPSCVYLIYTLLDVLRVAREPSRQAWKPHRIER